MILGQISYVDCIVFLILLTPQLLIHVGLFGTLACGIKALPFLLFRLPISFFVERFLTRRHNRSPFARHASLFEDFVIRCVRYAFAKIPASIGRVFFSKRVALPFLRFRMLRHGYLRSPVHWHEVSQNNLKGLWMISDEHASPDLVIYYAHGGGFSMGSSYFYLEFLLAWVTLLKRSGYRNPAIFALDYTLVPEACYPTQLQQALAGYQFVLKKAHADQICVSGDSAGGTLILSLLLHLARGHDVVEPKPGLAVLISPWVTLVSKKDKNTASDYLDVDSLHLYARQYAGTKVAVGDAMVSPGKCADLKTWKEASPSKGFAILFGSEEVFGPEIRDLVNTLRAAETSVVVHEEHGGIHAFPVVDMFLCDTPARRQRGLRSMVRNIQEQI